ncbi:MAG: D-alanyl-D-alanine carboxypeptidase/D-alanyl-D-alanine-endopeptidase [Phycisphaerales bacterium]|nr:D-alanyl-D-alanine carboxypeptidase/D-alanyl-D-alanine-endopeptidase [Phycisphaerales bacterium]
MHLANIALLLICALSQIASADLQASVEAILRSAKLGGGSVSVCVIDSETNQTLVDINSSSPMIPASNQKLLTSGTAIHVLGPQFQFVTKLYWDKQNASLTILGDGDPTIGDASLLGLQDWSTENKLLRKELEPWVHAVLESGIETVNTVWTDDRIFDRNYVHPSWPANQINNWYCAQVAGLNYHLNVVHFFPSPQTTTASLGTIVPDMPWMTFGNKTTSKTGKNAKSSFWVARPPNSNKMTARGNVKGTHTQPVKVALHNPAEVFGQVLARELRSSSIKVLHVTEVAEDASSPQGTLLHEHTTPLETVLRRSNQDSHNLYAEALLKRTAAASTGSSGTFDEGAFAVARSVSQRLDIPQSSLTPADGSGMSRDNRVSTFILASWLASFDLSDQAGTLLLNSLATPGTGTLKNRFADVELFESTVHAKSGYLSGVCALSGYLLTKEHHPIAFSIVVNGVKGSVRGAKKMQENIIALLAQSYS